MKTTFNEIEISHKLTVSALVSFWVNLTVQLLAGLSTEYVKFNFFARYLMTSKTNPPYSFSPVLVNEMICHGGFWKRTWEVLCDYYLSGKRFTFITPTWYVAIGKLTPRNPCTMCGKMTSVIFIPRVGIHDPESIKCAEFLSRAKKLPHVMAEAIRQNRHLPQIPPVAKVSSISFVCEKNSYFFTSFLS